MPIVLALELSKAFGRQDASVTALDRVSVGFEAGRFTSIMGPSGSGKSTLLHCLAGLERATSGSVVLDGTDLARLSDGQLTTLRRDRLGFVFQAFNLIPTLTAEENITLSERICGARVDRQWLAQLVEVLDLGDRLGHRPSELSGGQQQRVAIARALAHRPTVVFADEPTGNLDSHTGADVLGFLRLAVEQFGQTVVMVTHDPEAALWADRVLHLVDGRIAADLDAPTRETLVASLGGSGQALAALPSRRSRDQRVIDEFELPDRSAPGVDDAPAVWPHGTRRGRDEVEDTRTQEIALLAVERVRALDAAVARNAAAPDALREELGADQIRTALERLSPTPGLPAESAEVVEQARRILGELPGPVVPDEGGTDAHG